jgi:hypothetical protein
MAARDHLPEAPGANIRVEPYRISVRLQHASPAWRAVAKPYYEAAKAWRTELHGYEHWNDRGVVSFGSWRRLRNGEPAAFAAYEEARVKVIAQPTDHPEDLADKIQIVAEILGVADPRKVSHCWSEDVPEGGWTLADRLFAILWKDAHGVRRRVEADREKARKKGKR